jgi:hypothetical protein
MKPSTLTRRHFLRAAGTVIALPALESIGFRAFGLKTAIFSIVWPEIDRKAVQVRGKPVQLWLGPVQV